MEDVGKFPQSLMKLDVRIYIESIHYLGLYALLAHVHIYSAEKEVRVLV